MEKDASIYVAGHRGLVGGAIIRALKSAGFTNLITHTHAQVDLTDAGAVDRMFASSRPRYVFMAAARVGGIHANDTQPAQFIRDNLLIQTHVIHAAHTHGVEKLLFLGSSCIYPKYAPQPIREEYLLTGALEPTNDAYAVAKIAGIQMVKAYHRQYGMAGLNVMPTNLYGPGDNFDLNTSHVLPALLRKFHHARVHGEPTVTVWGTGTPRREFLHVDDLADACLFLMKNHQDPEPLNVGTGQDVSIRELAQMIGQVVGFTGELVFDASKPDGTPRKLLDVSRVNALGWTARTSLLEGLQQTYRWYVDQVASSDG